MTINKLPAAKWGDYLAQDCQRRHSQASIEPVWGSMCFLSRTMWVAGIDENFDEKLGGDQIGRVK
ncbi:MAG: hypothetical protein V4805_14345 [Pseudomonadota bacterium]